MLKFFRENNDQLFLLGVTFTIIGAAIFLGATPRGHKLNNPGEAWILAVPLISLGAALLIFHWYLQR